MNGAERSHRYLVGSVQRHSEINQDRPHLPVLRRHVLPAEVDLTDTPP